MQSDAKDGDPLSEGSIVGGFNESGNFGVGVGAIEGRIHAGMAAASAGVYSDVYSTTDGHSPVWCSRKSASDTLGTLVETADGDYLGALHFQGIGSGGGRAFGEQVTVVQKGAAGATALATELSFSTFTDAGVSTTQLVLQSNGNALFGAHSTHIDNMRSFFGTSSDAAIYYDGSHLVINPKVVGTGHLNVLGDIYSDTGMYYSPSHLYFRGGAGSNTYFDGDGDVIFRDRADGSNARMTLDLSTGILIMYNSAEQEFIKFDPTGVTYFNRNNLDIDCSFGSTTTDFLLYTDSGNSRIGIGTNTPVSSVEVKSSSPILTITDSSTGVASNLYLLGTIAFSGSDASAYAAGVYASIEAYSIDTNANTQASQNEGGALYFNVYRHVVGVDVRTKQTALIIDNFGSVKIPADSQKLYFGAGDDATVYYDATNLIINPKAVGSGILDVLGTLQTDGYNAADGTAGASATVAVADLEGDTQTLTFKNGLYTGVAETVAKRRTFVLYNTTTDDTATELFLNGSSTRLTIAEGETWFFSLHAVGRQTNDDRTVYGAYWTGVLTRNSGGNATVSNYTKIADYLNDMGWSFGVSADTTNQSLKVTVTGGATDTVKWVASVELTMVSE